MPILTRTGLSVVRLNRSVPNPSGPSRVRLGFVDSEDFHVPVDLETLVRDAVRLHGPRVFESSHLDDLEDELDLPILSLIEAKADDTIRDVLHEAIPRRPRVFVLHFGREDARGARRLELLTQEEQLLPALLVIREQHVEEADRVDRDPGRADPFDAIRKLA